MRKLYTFTIFIATVHCACATTNTHQSELQRAALEHGSPAANDRSVLVAPGDVELGDLYVIAGPARFAIGSTHAVSGKDGAPNRIVKVPKCAGAKDVLVLYWDGIGPEPPRGYGAAVLRMRDDQPSPTIAHDWVAIEMAGPADARTCLRGTRLAEPLGPFHEFWCKRLGRSWRCIDMAYGGGSPQCEGGCDWFQRVAQ